MNPEAGTPFGALNQVEAGVGGGVGHNLPQEAPHAFAQAVIDVDHFQAREPGA